MPFEQFCNLLAANYNVDESVLQVMRHNRYGEREFVQEDFVTKKNLPGVDEQHFILLKAAQRNLIAEEKRRQTQEQQQQQQQGNFNGNKHCFIATNKSSIIVYQNISNKDIENGFLKALDTAGIRTTKIDARSLTHAQVSQNIGAPGDKVMTTPLVRFLTTCFR